MENLTQEFLHVDLFQYKYKFFYRVIQFYHCNIREKERECNNYNYFIFSQRSLSLSLISLVHFSCSSKNMLYINCVVLTFRNIMNSRYEHLTQKNKNNTTSAY